MKTFTVLLPMFGLAILGYAGQTNQIDFKRTGAPPQPNPLQQEGTVGTVSTNSIHRGLRVEQKYGGVLPDLQKRKTLFSKSPPPTPGREFQNVSVNPITGRADGIILFSINF